MNECNGDCCSQTNTCCLQSNDTPAEISCGDCGGTHPYDGLSQCPVVQEGYGKPISVDPEGSVRYDKNPPHSAIYGLKATRIQAEHVYYETSEGEVCETNIEFSGMMGPIDSLSEDYTIMTNHGQVTFLKGQFVPDRTIYIINGRSEHILQPEGLHLPGPYVVS